MIKKFMAAVALACILCGSADARKKAKHVVMIGFDGWSAACFRELPEEDLPNIYSLIHSGAWTTHKRSVMPSASAINWATQFMGVPTEMHGYYKWNSKAPEIDAAQIGPNGLPSTIFTILREQRPSAESGCLYNWTGIGYVTDTTAMSYHYYDPDRNDKAEGYSPLSYTRKYAVPYIKEHKPELFVCYFDDSDGAGHRYGWGSAEYMDMLRKLDVCVGEIIQAIKDAGIWNDTIVVMSSDHGGQGRGHGHFTIEELETPFIVSGRKVRQDYEITQPVMQFDVPAVMAYALGLDIPEWWIGRPLKSIFK